MIPQVAAFESAESLFLFLRRVLSVYNTYSKVVDTKDNLVEYYSWKDEQPQYHLGEDTYLYLLGVTLCKQMGLDKTMSSEEISWTVANVISDLHGRIFVRHGEKVLVQFLYDLGYQLTLPNARNRDVIVQYRQRLSSPVTISDPFDTLLQSKNLALTALDTTILGLLSGPHSFEAIIDVCRKAMDIEGFGYAIASNGSTSFLQIKSVLETGLKPLHKTQLCLNVMIDGANAAYLSQVRATRLWGGPTSVALLSPIAPPPPPPIAVSRAEFMYETTITQEMVRQMGAVLTRHAGLVQTGDRKNEKQYIDKRLALGTRENQESMVFLQNDDESRGGESATDLMLSTLKGAVLSKSSKMLKQTLRNSKAPIVAKGLNADGTTNNSPTN